MRASARAHDVLAALLAYPQERALEQEIDAALTCLREECPRGAGLLEPFATTVAALTAAELAELYTRTFGHTEERALEVGWHVHGESYGRGTFLVRIRGSLRKHGIPERGELPDHLIHVLPLLGRAGPQWCGRLAHEAVIPAVRKIHDALESFDSPWAPVTAATLAVLALHDAPAAEPEAGPYHPAAPVAGAPR